MTCRARRPKRRSVRAVSLGGTAIGTRPRKRNDPGEINLPGSLYRGVQSAGNPWAHTPY